MNKEKITAITNVIFIVKLSITMDMYFSQCTSTINTGSIPNQGTCYTVSAR